MEVELETNENAPCHLFDATSSRELTKEFVFPGMMFVIDRVADEPPIASRQSEMGERKRYRVDSG